MSRRLTLFLSLTGTLLAITWVWGRTPPQANAPEPRARARTDARGATPTHPLDSQETAIRLLLGVGDDQSRPWNGHVTLDEGTIVAVEGWRFREGDSVTGAAAWKSRSLPIRKTAAKKTQPKKKTITPPKIERNGPGNSGPPITPTGVIVRLKARPEAKLTVVTDQGTDVIPLSDLVSADPHDVRPRRYLSGRIEAEVVPSHAPLAATPAQEDFPAAVSDGKAGAWVAYVAHEPRGPDTLEALTERPASFASLVAKGGGDQIKLSHFDGTRVEQTADVTEPGRDVWRPAVALDGAGRVVVVWSEFVDSNWDLYSRSFAPASRSWTETRRLTTQPGTDTAPSVVTAGGRVHVAWQGWIEGQAEILLAPLDAPAQARNISQGPANDWSPALAADPSGGLVLAYDSYRNENYDIFLYTQPASGAPRTIAVTDSTRFEARPSVAVDRQGRAWVAYEVRDDNWGKDYGNIPEARLGACLYLTSGVKVRCVDGAKVFEVADPAAAVEGRRMHAFARLTIDANGHPRLLYRDRQEAIWGANAVMIVGAVWVEQATALVGKSWTPPRTLARSDNLLDNRPALVARPEGDVLAFHSSDGRLHREVEHTPELSVRYFSHYGAPPGVDNNDLFVSALTRMPGIDAPELAGEKAEPAPVAPVHPNEAADVARVRGHRIQADGKTYQLMRGDFHRHTELSMDGGNDGALEDMWRYALDAGRLDWIGNGDHDNGGGKEYTWWLVQKTTDLYHNPPAFVPMFTYERSVPYPGGHRNVMFPYRGVRTLPRLVDEEGVRTGVRGVDLDAQMLYGYLNELGGICASHTTGTGMGTDWRANDPKVEPFVEIYQGTRNSYESFGSPRSARGPSEALGGWRPLGMIWNALAFQYRLGFHASSDHISTHISFAFALAEAPTRAAVFDAFKRRHCYAATDNILLDVRSGAHLMGDEFETDGPATLEIMAHGTAPIARVDIVKDFVHVYSTEPKTERVKFQWTDTEDRVTPVSWYYVRILQEDGELAWASPMWVHRRANPTPP